jgi:hypothetical protein
MPFIRGRYHMNPIVGQAMEAAREAEAARLAESEGQSAGGADASAGEAARSGVPDLNQAAIHRVEIEAAEMVPAHSGRAQKGFVARVHREVPGQRSAGAPSGQYGSEGPSPCTETHVFSNHQDLVNFLHHELGKDNTTK